MHCLDHRFALDNMVSPAPTTSIQCILITSRIVTMSCRLSRRRSQLTTQRNEAFLIWLAQQARRDDPVGDCARDMLDDPDWPQTATTFDTAHAYLTSINASTNALDALREAWDEWQRRQ